ncbi:MAG: Signal transduction histidine-protein kinase BarA [Syntrophus sp. PtaU1.Bin208]|nr:MAG: Signal transduction histidine-protein kinase BarA [Syntrophus sp. PtaU1.Bin208]
MEERDRASKPYILLVENDPLSQEIVKEMLEHCGCRVHVAGTGPEAVDAFSRQPFDMIFMECQIPGMDGFKTAAIIRSMESANPGMSVSGRRIPIAALAASALSGGREEVLRSGMDDYLNKPCRISDIQQLLDKWLSSRQTEGGASLSEGEEKSPAIDREALNTLAALQPDGAKALLTKLITVYFDSSSKQMKSILDAIKGQDLPSLLTAAHTLKSSSASLGARIFAEQCKDLEMMARSGVIEGAETRAEPLEREYGRVREALDLYLASL